MSWTYPLLKRGRGSCLEHKGTFWGNGNVLYLDDNGNYTGINSCQNSSYILLYVHYNSIIRFSFKEKYTGEKKDFFFK